LFNFSIGGHAGNTYPIFTLESNFITSAAIAELLLQSHDNKIELLPALPKAWSSGHVIGLRARGGFEVDQYWDKGELKRAVIYSEFTQPCIVHYKELLKVTADEELIDFEQVSTGLIRFDATSGEEYTLIPGK
jgi:alpha-L-fucosidase 2